jgi:8-oxo-dGTP pyrophosphatase MutT (NUDIX family)
VSGDSHDDVAMRVRAALAARPPRRLAVPGFDRAAVLVPLLRRPEEPMLLFTRRTEALARHRGEISFPGGHLEGREDARAAALREAEEEVGLDPLGVEVAGELDDRPSVTRFVVTPVVALVSDPPATFRRDEREVEEVFEVPLRRFLAPDAARVEWWDASRLPPETPRRPLLDLGSEEVDAAGRYAVYFFDIAPHLVIWGLTARVVRDLVLRAFP